MLIGYVTQADDLRFGKAGHRLGDDAGRVEVDDPGVRRQLSTRAISSITGMVRSALADRRRQWSSGRAAISGGVNGPARAGSCRRGTGIQHESGAVNGVVQREVR